MTIALNESPRDSSPEAREAPLRAVEHHSFQMRQRSYLFDVNAFSVLLSQPVDGEILARARGETSASGLVEELAARGWDRELARERVELLREERFLLRAGEEPRRAELRDAAPQATFMLNVAQRCNLTCPYCYVNEGLFDYEKKPVARMEDETADELVERLYALFPDLTSYTYHFYGGEPLLNFEGIRNIVAQAKRKAAQTGTKAAFHITTNGTLLDREVADFMAENQFTIIFSIDADKARHDELRRYTNGEGSYDDVARNLEYLRGRRGIKLVLSAVIREDLPLSQAFDRLEHLGAHAIKAEHTRLSAEDPLALDPRALHRHLEELTRTLFEHYVDELEGENKPRDHRLFSKILGLLTRTRRTFFCMAGEKIFGVAANGEIYPCALHVGRPQSLLGHIATGVDAERQRKFRHDFSWQAQEGCQSCWTRHLCGGGCSAMVDRFGHEDCDVLRAETEAAIAIYQHFMETDPAAIYGLVSPEIVRFIRGKVASAAEPHSGCGSGDGAEKEVSSPTRLRVLPSPRRASGA